MKDDVTSLAPLQADQRIGYGADTSQFFDLWLPASAAIGAAVMIHGGFWRARYDLGHASFICAALATRGVFTANLEYRRVGQPGGGWPGSLEDAIAGAKAVAEHLHQVPIVIGHSAGGYLALRLASEPLALRAVVALAPVADLELAYQLNLSNGAVAEFLGGTPDTVPDRYQAASPSRHSTPVRRVILHGMEDEVVPIALSRAFVGAGKTDPVPPTLIELPRVGHMDLIDPESQAWPSVLDVVLKLLRM